MSHPTPPTRFHTTEWPLIGALSDADEVRRRAAAEQLANAYWRPIYGWLRRSGQTCDRAEDITQGFFTDVVLGRHLFERAAAERGRLRSLILASLKRYVIDDHRRDAARTNGKRLPAKDIACEERALATEGPADPERWYHRRWANAVLDEALRRCERHYRQNNRAEHWLLFERRVIRPASGWVEAQPIETAARELGIRDAHAARSILQQVKKRVAELVQEVVGESASHDPSAEFEAIQNLLAGSD